MKDNLKRERLPSDIRSLQIQKAGKEVFISKGFTKTTMTDIYKQAGISTGCLYSYYKRKNDILYDLILEKFNLINFLELILKEVDSILYVNIRKIIIDKMYKCHEFRSMYAIFLVESKDNQSLKKLNKQIKLRFIDYFNKKNLERFICLEGNKFYEKLELLILSIEFLDIKQNDCNHVYF